MQAHFRLYTWWYFAIALGFLLLAVDHALTGARAWPVILRLVIAAGFGALGYAELRARVRGK